MQEYKIEVVDNHLIINIEKHRILIDSGSPKSFGNIQQIRILNNTFQVAQEYMRFNINQFSFDLGFEIDLLLGGNILNNFNYKIDLLNKVISFSENAIVPNNCFELPLSFYTNIPIIEYKVNENKIRAFFDTGAKISYINRNIANNFNRIGETEDFYPGWGKFNVDLYEIPIIINSYENTFKFGVLPNQLEMSLLIDNTQSILGNDFLKYYIVSISHDLNKFYCQRC